MCIRVLTLYRLRTARKMEVSKSYYYVHCFHCIATVLLSLVILGKFGESLETHPELEYFEDTSREPEGTGQDPDWRKIALQEHNVLRRKHSVVDLASDKELDQLAQKYAEYLATNNLFDHSTDNDFGENLMLTLAENEVDAGRDAVDSWYEEIQDYNFTHPGYKLETSHFTTMMWKATTHVGLGMAWNAHEEQYVVVANYKPGGNVDGEYQDNVFPVRE